MFVFPPRGVEHSLSREVALEYQKHGVAQLKYNDQHITISINDEIKVFTRLGKSFNNGHLITNFNDSLQNLKSLYGNCYLDGGAIILKNKLLNDIVVIWDILETNKILIGTTYLERYQLLYNAIKRPENYFYTINGVQYNIGIKITNNVILPHNFLNFNEAWQLVYDVNAAVGWDGNGEPALEGIVVKMNAGKLKRAFGIKNNSHWFFKSRIRTKRHNY